MTYSYDWNVPKITKQKCHQFTKTPKPTKVRVLDMNYWWILVNWRFGGKKTFQVQIPGTSNVTSIDLH